MHKDHPQVLCMIHHVPACFSPPDCAQRPSTSVMHGPPCACVSVHQTVHKDHPQVLCMVHYVPACFSPPDCAQRPSTSVMHDPPCACFSPPNCTQRPPTSVMHDPPCACVSVHQTAHKDHPQVLCMIHHVPVFQSTRLCTKTIHKCYA